MKIISWNVNGLRACVKKGFNNIFSTFEADIFCLQETKLQYAQIDLKPKGYSSYWNYAEKKGYSGTCILTKSKPISVCFGMGIDIHSKEGRLITLEFEKFFMVTTYTPNSKRDLERLEYRLRWEDDFRNYLYRLSIKKPTIVCGDLNVAHEYIDLKNSKANEGNSGFTIEERNMMSKLLELGFVDTYRNLYPDKMDAYSWWSYREGVREKNIGWRIDYFLVSINLEKQIKDAYIYSEIKGSDHCPIGLEIIFE